MTERTVIIGSKVGLHARPAALFSQAAAKTGVAITLVAGDRSSNAASILGILSLGVGHGDEVTLTSEAPDAAAAIDELALMLESDLDAA